jgi:predicted protein tyrosine phosphatase
MPNLPLIAGYDGHFITPRIAVGRWPRPQDVAAIDAAGVRGVVNVLGVCQAAQMAYVHYLPKHIHWLHLGFWDGVGGGEETWYKETLSAGFARLVVRESAAALRDYGPLLIHCAGGFGRSANLAAILLAATEGITPDQAIERIRAHRATSPFYHDEFWQAAGSAALVDLAREVLAQPPAVPQEGSPFLAEGWFLSPPSPAGDIATAPHRGIAEAAGWRPVMVQDAFVDIHEQCGPIGIVHLAHRVHVAESGTWILHLGHDGGARLFVDGRPLAATAGTVNPAPFRRTQALVDLPAGEHEISIAIDRAGGRGWGIYLSFELPAELRVPGRSPVYPRGIGLAG